MRENMEWPSFAEAATAGDFARRNRKLVPLLCAGALIVAGCSTVSSIVAVDPAVPEVSGSATNDYATTTGMVRRAVVAGLTAVDPAAYDGWAGACPGCDVDASTFALLCRERGLQVAELHNNAATIQGVLAVSRLAWVGMKPGDLFVLYISGHGGQVADKNGDENDGQDETLCLWDGQLSDDVLGALWEEIPAGVRVLFVSDTCNSGTNFRKQPRSLKKSMPREYTGQAIHYGGCADGMSSYGDDQGGTFTTALIDAWDPAGTYRSWFDAAARKMPKNQVPAYAEYGQVTAGFRDGQALE